MGGYILPGSDRLCGFRGSYYDLIDLLAIPITDNHIRGVSDVLDYYTDMEIFPFGVPHKKDKYALEYYLRGITRLKGRLEELTGVEITESRLMEAIELCNRERELLREISLMRKDETVPVSSKDFVALHHGSFLADKRVMVELLESLLEELKGGAEPSQAGPRILLTGSTLAQGDSKLEDLIEKAGGVVVIEEFGEGMRPYWEGVKADGHLLKNLTDCYFWRRVPPAWFRPDVERLDFLVQLARDFHVAGVIWYQLMYRESYKLESYYFPKMLKEKTGLSMLTLESDYDPSETGQMRTRIETFMEAIERG